MPDIQKMQSDLLVRQQKIIDSLTKENRELKKEVGDYKKFLYIAIIDNIRGPLVVDARRFSEVDPVFKTGENPDGGLLIEWGKR